MNRVLMHMRTAVVVAALLAVVVGDLGGQTQTKGRVRRHRMFAAQTGPDQVTLVWDQVPGATEYRVYLPDPGSSGPPTTASRPVSVGSGSSRRTVITGVQKLAGGAYLLAMNGRQVLFQGKFDPVTRAPLARPAPPAAVVAAESGPTEVTVSWDAVPGATAYSLGRAVGGGGLQMLCSLCPPEATFVDTAATPGLKHTYTVQAIFPVGVSARIRSDPITVGAAQLAAAGSPGRPMAGGTPVAGTASDYSNPGAGTATAPPATGAPTTGTPTTGYPPAGQPAGVTIGYPPPGQPAGATTGYPPPGQPAGTTTYTPPPPGQPAGALPGAGTQTTPVTSQPASADYLTSVAGRLQDELTKLVGSVATAGTTVHAASPITASTEQVAGWVGGIKETLRNILGNVSSRLAANGTLAFTGATLSASDPLVTMAFALRDQVANVLQSIGAGTLAAAGAIPTSPFAGEANLIRSVVGELMGGIGLDPAAAASGSTVHAATPVTTPTTSTPTTSTPTTATPSPGPGAVTACRLDYQRADNMWAAFGRPDGPLGTESISLAPGQRRAFVTDWKYEKQRNDGTNYYGSHLRIATNPTGRAIKLLIRMGAVSWVRLEANSTKQYQADLMEVSCET